MGDHDAAGPGTVLGEDLVVVERQAAEVVGAGGGDDLATVPVGRPLAHVVDGARGVADAGEQPVRAADQLDALEQEGVLLADDGAPVVCHAQPVDLREHHVEATRVEGGTVGLVLLDVDAGAVAQRVVRARDAEVVQLLLVEGADGLRRVLDLQRQVGRAFRDTLLPLRRDDHLVEHGGRGRRRLRRGGLRGRRLGRLRLGAGLAQGGDRSERDGGQHQGAGLHLHGRFSKVESDGAGRGGPVQDRGVVRARSGAVSGQGDAQRRQASRTGIRRVPRGVAGDRRARF
jgi:hypothetical protein